jgi:hypothetical protein
MIALNCLVGLSLLLGGLRHREHLQSAGCKLVSQCNHGIGGAGPGVSQFHHVCGRAPFFYRTEIFLIVVSLLLYGIFLLIQTCDTAVTSWNQRTLLPANSAYHPLQALNGFSCGDAAGLSNCRYFAGGKVRYPVGQRYKICMPQCLAAPLLQPWCSPRKD